MDADIVAYNIASTAESYYDFGDSGRCVSVEDLEVVLEKTDKAIATVVSKLKLDEIIICLSVPSSEGFRLKVLPSYKSNRVAERPVHLQAVKDYMAAEYTSYIKPTLEADDVMGILATHPLLISGKKVIISEDKDMQTIPCWLYRPRRDKKPWKVSEEHADHFHMIQTLMGDAVDGYKGCPNIGIVKATKILEGLAVEDYWGAVVDAYEKAGLTEADALVQAQVARICRHDNYDFTKNEVVLWQPE